MSHIKRKLYVESILEKTLRDLEERERVFETYKVASGSNLRFKIRSIMDFIDFEMHRVIRVPLHQIYNVDPALCELLCNAFFGRTKCWKREDINDISSQGYDIDLWPSCRYHIYAGVLCMYACIVMEKLFKGVHDEYMAKLYQENRCIFEQRIVGLLNDVFRENASITLNVLEIDYERIFKEGETKFFEIDPVLRKPYTRSHHAATCWGGCCRVRTPSDVQIDDASIELMAVAFRAKAMDFLAHNCCQSLIERRWHGRLRLSPTRTLISYLFPCFIYKEFALRKARGPELGKDSFPEEPAQSVASGTEPMSNQKERLLGNISKNSGFSNTVDLDSSLIIAPDSSTPTSVGLEYLQKADTHNTPASAKNLMKCSSPRFPIREDNRRIVHSGAEPSSSTIERIAQYTVFPIEEERRRDYSPAYDRFDVLPSYSNKKPQWLWSILKFYTTTKAKFFYHVIFRVAYVILYSWVLVAKPRRRSTTPNLSNYWPELLVALVQLSQLCDCVAAIKQRMPPASRISGLSRCHIWERYSRKARRIRLGFFEWTSEHLFGFYRNMVIVVNSILLLVLLIHAGFAQGDIVGCWAALATFSDLIFHVSFLFAAVSVVRYLSVFYFFSVLTFMLRRMVKTLGKFLLIFVMFWMIFAVCHISMAEEYSLRSNHSLAWMMFQNGAFEIFGEVDDEDKIGSVTGCGDITWTSIWTANISDIRCLFRSTLIPITVFTYMLIASIMLVNLLTALLSKEYDEVSGGGSAVYWKYENYFLLATYESKLWLPPPLSLFYYLLHIIVALTRTITCFSCIFCICCSSSILKFNPFLFIPKWLNRIVRAVEGRPWGTLKQVRRHYRDQLDLNEVRRLVPKKNKSMFHSRLKELLNSSSRSEGSCPEERIQNAQALFQNIFDILMECISEETSEIRTRANTAMGDLQNQLHQCMSHSMPNLMLRKSASEISRPSFLHCDLVQPVESTFPFDFKYIDRHS